MTSRIFVCEFITAGGFAGKDLPEDLLEEGEAMRDALLDDLSSIEGVTVFTCRDSRLPPLNQCDSYLVQQDEDCWENWEKLIEEVDAFWPIAPETDGALERLTRLAEAQGVTVIGSTSQTVKLCSSKSELASHLQAHQLNVIPSQQLDVVDDQMNKYGWVVKPDDGAGCEDTSFYSSVRSIPAQTDWKDYILQPYLPGESISLSVHITQGHAELLTINQQHVTCQGQLLRHEGVTIDIYQNRHDQMQVLAQQIADVIPGLNAYIGIDIILSDTVPVIVEINPRLTSSYVGLSKKLGDNIAYRCLEGSGIAAK